MLGLSWSGFDDFLVLLSVRFRDVCLCRTVGLGFIEGWRVAYSRLLSGSERVSSRDQRMRRVKDQDGRVRDQGIKRTQGLGDQRTKGPEDQGTRGPRDQGTRGPGDQRIRGPP